MPKCRSVSGSAHPFLSQVPRLTFKSRRAEFISLCSGKQEEKEGEVAAKEEKEDKMLVKISSCSSWG